MAIYAPCGIAANQNCGPSLGSLAARQMRAAGSGKVVRAARRSCSPAAGHGCRKRQVGGDRRGQVGRPARRLRSCGTGFRGPWSNAGACGRRTVCVAGGRGGRGRAARTEVGRHIRHRHVSDALALPAMGVPAETAARVAKMALEQENSLDSYLDVRQVIERLAAHKACGIRLDRR